MRASVRFGNEIDLIFDHFKANNGIRILTDDRSALRKTGGRTLRATLETEIGVGVDRLLDHRSIFEANDQDCFVMFGGLWDGGGLSTAGR